MPAFLVLVLFEKYWGWRKGQDTVRTMDMISSLSSGITNVTKDVLGLSLVIISYEWLEKHLAIIHLPAGFWVYFAAFVALDFAGYWTHRVQHVVNLFWNGHIIHHSSEEFNLACALRQSIASIAKVFVVFLLPAALLGVPPKVIAIVAPLHLFAQFWYHTRHIKRMGWLEKIIVTPSHHRVHHAINPEYIDKNYGQILIIWDKLFGSFREESDDIPPVYGITRPAQTWNPIKINFMHIWLLIQDAWRTRRWRDKFRIWFMPTGWRPADTAAKYPVYKIDDVYHFRKYDTKHTGWTQGWTWCQTIILLLLLSYLFARIAIIGAPAIFLYGGFIFLSVYALSEFMDGSAYAVMWELARSAMGIALIVGSGDWFHAGDWWTGIRIILLIYFPLSVLITGWLQQKEKRLLAAL